MPITEINILSDYGLTLDHFYTLVKQSVGQLTASQYLQLQATAVPLDVSSNYKWFSYGNIARYGDLTIAPKPVSDLLVANPAALLSREYYLFISDLLSLVEATELDPNTTAQIDRLETANRNLRSHLNAMLQKRRLDWEIYANATMTPPGDLVAFQHWGDGQPESTELKNEEDEMARNEALVVAMRMRKYADPSQQQVVDAFARFTSPASRTRFPRYDDRTYGEEQSKFNAVYFARMADNDSSLFANRQITTVPVSLDTITNGTIGGFTNTIAKRSTASSSIKTDWSASASAGWGPFSFKANASNSTQVTDDFSHTEGISVGAKSLQALQLDTSAWFSPDLFRHPLVGSHRKLFERYLGTSGTLLYYPTHVIIARGFHLEFHSAQNWNYDYKSNFSSGGSASASFFGIGFGGGGSYSKSVHEQKVELRGHDLIFDDGDNVRVIGYNVFKNDGYLQDVVDNFGHFAIRAFK
jgi:hypothetical protein